MGVVPGHIDLGRHVPPRSNGKSNATNTTYRGVRQAEDLFEEVSYREAKQRKLGSHAATPVGKLFTLLQNGWVAELLQPICGWTDGEI
jgi:hypothetical protein